jgi:alpha-galactosidase
MLIVGWVGWGPQLHPTRLTVSEQYTHISLWALLSAPLLLGNDLSRMDDFTLNLLTNDEVLAINQDPLGIQAKMVLKKGNIQVWMKELEDASKAIGIFNLGEKDTYFELNWTDIKQDPTQQVFDVWRQKDLGVSSSFTTKILSHGVQLIKVKSTEE